jgi:hypothetical protein
MQNLDIVRGGNRIAMIDCENEALSDSDILANARLIAAAPDLLAALETALEMLIDSWGDEQIAAGDDQVANVIKDAIAKAKGN